jgi:hypothetical protein
MKNILVVLWAISFIALILVHGLAGEPAWKTFAMSFIPPALVYTVWCMFIRHGVSKLHGWRVMLFGEPSVKLKMKNDS